MAVDPHASMPVGARYAESVAPAGSYERHMKWLYGDKPRCLCDHAYRSLGRDQGIDTGRGWLRVTTHPKCPEHALCQGYTKAYRATQWNGEWLYCNVHPKANCPAQTDGSAVS